MTEASWFVDVKVDPILQGMIEDRRYAEAQKRLEQIKERNDSVMEKLDDHLTKVIMGAHTYPAYHGDMDRK
jgi:hypothetical protein